MNDDVANAVASDLRAMREAKKELGSADAYLSTREAVDACPVPVSEETLKGYPEWVLPRIEKNPAAKGSPLLFDPRDVRALPLVLKQWRTANQNDSVAELKRRRLDLLQRLDAETLTRSGESD